MFTTQQKLQLIRQKSVYQSKYTNRNCKLYLLTGTATGIVNFGISLIFWYKFMRWASFLIPNRFKSVSVSIPRKYVFSKPFLRKTRAYFCRMKYSISLHKLVFYFIVQKIQAYISFYALFLIYFISCSIALVCSYNLHIKYFTFILTLSLSQYLFLTFMPFGSHFSTLVGFCLFSLSSSLFFCSSLSKINSW